MSFFKPFPYTKYEFGTDSVKTNIKDIFRYIHVRENIIDDANGYKYYQIHDGERPDVVSYKLYGTPDYYWTFFIVNDTLHGGLSGWPLSSQEFEKYMDEEYAGVVISALPTIQRNSDQLITNYLDSVAGRFTIGETITGSLSGATGKIVAKNSRYNHITLENVTGSFKPGGATGDPENVQGETSLDFISSWQVFQRKIAPKYYTDANGLITDNSLFIPGGAGNNTLTYVSNREWETELNDKRSAIRAIRPELIQDFALKFKRLLNGSV